MLHEKSTVSRPREIMFIAFISLRSFVIFVIIVAFIITVLDSFTKKKIIWKYIDLNSNVTEWRIGTSTHCMFCKKYNLITSARFLSIEEFSNAQRYRY